MIVVVLCYYVFGCCVLILINVLDWLFVLFVAWIGLVG